MATGRTLHTVSATAQLKAPPRRVYDTIANYHSGHPRILPKQFSDLTVEQGGIGDGTVIRFKVRVYGRTDTYRAVVSEPEPGRMLVERNIAGNDGVSTFIVEPAAGGAESTVTIRTDIPARTGLAGRLERWLITKALQPIYTEELRLLESAARTDAAATA
jgi:polyketide cyclase/dehydrase/lipid transport protein